MKKINLEGKKDTIKIMLENQKLFHKAMKCSEDNLHESIELIVDKIWNKIKIYEWVKVIPLLGPMTSFTEEIIIPAKSRMLKTRLEKEINQTSFSEIYAKVIADQIVLEIEQEVLHDLFNISEKEVFDESNTYSDFDWAIIPDNISIQNNNLKIFKGNLLFPKNKILLGKNTNENYGYFYCPYISLSLLDVNPNITPISSSTCGIMMRYGKKYIKPERGVMYKTLTIEK